ncbi:DUF932 domain-containing protein [Eleftheria terrae]|uniref:DUF932 domain-containing protein n=1 Tax=Eleftheria terrae TaxID=1597781 RepID=UPI00263AD0AC|nr:DUF932 domain-containing protein [Eleftheria terrae]WKB50565.1 DUF945 domain-containing protein [Eleftheria terrae]
MQLVSSFRNPQSIRENRPLTDDEIRRVAPSIYAPAAHESRSERYSYIPTSEVLAKLRQEGFEPFAACQSRTRDAGKREHTKHLVRLRHPSQIEGREVNEILLLNSHDGSSSYQMLAGVFVFVCSNGLVVGQTAADVRIPHKGDVISRVVEGAHVVLDGFTRVVEDREVMKSVQLHEEERLAFASAALEVRYEPDETKPAPVTAQQILMPARAEDRGHDLWTTFNVVQERLIRGGLRGRASSGRPTRTRPVTGIDQDVRLNRALWTLGREMARLKAKA